MRNGHNYTMKINYQLYIITLVLGLIISGVNHAQSVVITEVLTSEVLQRHDRVIGNIKASSEANLAVRESGYVVQIFVNEGSRVKTGDSLLKLDDQRLKSSLAQAEAEVKQAEALLAQRQTELFNAQADVTAYTYSAKKQAISKRQLRLAETERNRIKAMIDEVKALIVAKQAQVELLTIRLTDLLLTAPFSGVVIERFAELGEWFVQGQTAISLIKDNQLEAWLEVPERFANTLVLKPKEKITLQVNNIATEATVQATIRKVDNRARTFILIASFNNTQYRWMTGMSALAWLPVSQKRAVFTVSQNALIQNNHGYQVFQVTSTEAGEIAVAVPVDILFYQKNRVAITSPQLSVGNHIVVEGNERLMPGPVTAVHESKQIQASKSSQR